MGVVIDIGDNVVIAVVIVVNCVITVIGVVVVVVLICKHNICTFTLICSTLLTTTCRVLLSVDVINIRK